MIHWFQPILISLTSRHQYCMAYDLVEVFAARPLLQYKSIYHAPLAPPVPRRREVDHLGRATYFPALAPGCLYQAGWFYLQNQVRHAAARTIQKEYWRALAYRAAKVELELLRLVQGCLVRYATLRIQVPGPTPCIVHT